MSLILIYALIISYYAHLRCKCNINIFFATARSMQMMH